MYAHLCAMVGGGGGGAHLPTQQRSRRGGGQGLLRRPLAGLLELVLNEVLQGSELCLAAAASVHVVLICKEPTVRGTGGGSGPRHTHPGVALEPGACPRESHIWEEAALTIHLGTGSKAPTSERRAERQLGSRGIQPCWFGNGGGSGVHMCPRAPQQPCLGLFRHL